MSKCSFCEHPGVVLVAVLTADPDQRICQECHSDPRIPSKEITMTPVRAIQILHRVWGSQENLSAQECSEIWKVELPGETSWSTLCRVAGIDGTGIDHLHPQAWLAVRSLCAQREIELAREGKYP